MNPRLLVSWSLGIGLVAVGGCREGTKVNPKPVPTTPGDPSLAGNEGTRTEPSAAGAGGFTNSTDIAAGHAGIAGQPATPDVSDVVIEGEYPIALATGLAPTPPMGWSSWNSFACNIRAIDVARVADAMVSSGMADAGYRYVNIDDCWQGSARDASGNVQVASSFLAGYVDHAGNAGTMQTLVDYVHSLGLKMGLYSDRGTATCAGRAGAQGYEEQDAITYAAWGIDYLKYDNCNADAASIQSQYQLMRDHLRTAVAASVSQRPIVYSLCAWNFYEWALGTGQLWRTTPDITPVFAAATGSTVVSCAYNNSRFAAYHGPNGWNDPDMLEVGVGALSRSEPEQRSHFGLWAIMAAPLIAGNDLTKMTGSVQAILTNRDVIAVDQDPLGLQGFPVRVSGDLEIWMKPLNQRGARAILLLNKGSTAADITFTLADLNLAQGALTLKDLWSGAVQEDVRAPYTATAVPAHGSVMLKVVGTEPPPPRGTRYLSDLDWIYAANGNGPVERDMTAGKSQAKDGVPIVLDGVSYQKGLGVVGGSKIIYRLGRGCRRFRAKANLDPTSQISASVVFKVLGDETLLYESPVIRPAMPTENIDISVANYYRLTLLVTNGMDTVNSADMGIWADAQVECD